MLAALPATALEMMEWDWSRIAPHYEELAARPLSAGTVEGWLADWTRVHNLLDEGGRRLYLATTLDTTDREAEARFHHFLGDIQPPMQAAEQRLKQKLLESGLEPPGFAIPLRNLRAEADLFREANLPLLTEEQKLVSEYNKIAGAQTVEWAGREITLPGLAKALRTPDRAERERAWRLGAERQLADREPINDLWARLLGLRRRLAANAGFDDYRAFRWRQLLRFDYTPADCARFWAAIEEVVVPAAGRIYDRHRRRLGVERLRPWDLGGDTNPLRFPPLRTFDEMAKLEAGCARIFARVDPHLGERFDVLRREGLLDLANRPGKGPGANCTFFPVVKRPFIFMNAVGLAGEVRTLLHEAGHAFHGFERADLPYAQQGRVPMEFSEVASMAMELLAAPYLTEREGGFYTDADAARARAEHLEGIILFWPYMAVVDAFQHWVYEHPDRAADAATCDARWAELWGRFMPGVDWSGLDDAAQTGWQRKRHIHRRPFYYVEYGLAQLGAVQVWRGALADQRGAVARYRRALALGGTVPLPELYAAAGARFAFDAGTVREAVALVEGTIAELEGGRSPV